MNNHTLVEISHLAYTYLAGTPLATVALRDASLHVERGQIAAVVGQSGAGKSTLIHFVNGLLRPEGTGVAWVLGQEMADASLDLATLRKRVGLVFQYPQQQMIERYVGDDVAYGLRQIGLTGPALRERVQQAMAAVGLDFAAFVDRHTSSLSGGEMRRVAIAGVLALEPDLLILDEATTGLDPLTRQSLCDLLLRLRRERDLTIVMVTNDMDQVAAMADSVTVLQEGATVAQGTPYHVFCEVDIAAYGLAMPTPGQLIASLRQAGVPIEGQAIDLDQAEERIWRAMQR